MCITFLWVNPDFVKQDKQSWQLVLINNRDEDYTRPTLPVSWKDGVLCGRDLEVGKEGGTWLGVNERGNLAFIHNMNYPPPKNPDELQGRGHIVEDYVARNVSSKNNNVTVSPLTYAQELLKSAHRYNGFSVTLMDRCTLTKNGINNNNNLNNSSNLDSTTPRWRIITCSNRTDTGMEVLEPGFHGFGNSPINKPFKRVKHGLQNFKLTCQEWSTHKNIDQFIDGLLKVLTDKEQCYPDDVLATYQPNLSKDMLKYMSSCFVEFPPQFKYGTRTHSIILIDGQDHVRYVEKTLTDHVTKKWTMKKHEFDLLPLAKTTC